METVKISAEVKLESCAACGAFIALTAATETSLRASHGTFYCPNGHSNVYREKTDADRLRALLSEAQERNTALISQKAVLEGEIEAMTKRSIEMKARVNAGECPYCGQHVFHLARHIGRKHPQKQGE